MRLLVVGATGGLGRLIVAEAIARGHEVAALVRDPARANLPEPVVTVRGLPDEAGRATLAADLRAKELPSAHCSRLTELRLRSSAG